MSKKFQFQPVRLELDPNDRSVRVGFRMHDNNVIVVPLSPQIYAGALAKFLENSVVLKLVTDIFEGYTLGSNNQAQLSGDAMDALSKLELLVADIDRVD